MKRNLIKEIYCILFLLGNSVRLHANFANIKQLNFNNICTDSVKCLEQTLYNKYIL